MAVSQASALCSLWTGAVVLCVLHHTSGIQAEAGSWTAWGGWSDCHSSCGNGTMSRMRACSGLIQGSPNKTCTGTGIEHKACYSGPCPDRTNWGPWSPWTQCSLTCDMGIQRRRRSCRHLGRHGETCAGDDDDSKSCFVRACSDGGWSDWSPWQPCSTTCDGGLQSRNRSCSNPTPSRFGKPCAGSDRDLRMCNTQHCAAPHLASQSTPPIAFSVNSPTGQLIGRPDGNGRIALFRTAVINVGGSYNMGTGMFTCPVDGIYRFAVALRSYHDTFCNIIKNHDVTLTYAQVSINADRDTGFNEVIVRLSKSDTVSLECDIRWENVDKLQGTSFSGHLLFAGA